MKRFRWTLCLLFVIMLTDISFALDLEILTENAGGEANYLCNQNQACGHNVDWVKEIMKRLGISHPITIMPLARAINELNTKTNIALFSTIRTPSREKLYKWVGPINVMKFVFLARADTNLSINSLDDAKKVDMIGCYKGDIRESILNNNGFKNLNPLFGADANDRNLRLLHMGRIDLLATSTAEWPIIARKNQIPLKAFKELYVFKILEAYIAFSSKIPDEVIINWQTTLDQIKKDGTYKQIFSKYETGPPRMAIE
ncbi:MAG: transporter substrate-binding domain-containing protein [Desulfamplus sp.]|nr:transporter substrate-binding domain-containing protein [Desulfamplus sp.]